MGRPSRASTQFFVSCTMHWWRARHQNSTRTCGKLVAGVVPALMSPAARQIVSNLTGVLVQAAHPKRIILFGSQARGDAAPHSDFDIMVVEEKPADRFAEMVRLNRLIRS